MVVDDIFDAITYGEASDIKLGNILDGQIDYGDHPQVINAINMGVLELHKRFDLHIKTFQIQHITGTKEYLVPADFLVLISAKNELGIPYAINDANADNIYTLSVYQYDSVYITIPFDAKLTTNLIDFQYKVRPNKLDPNTIIPNTTTVDLTDQFLEPIVNYVAYRLFAGMNISSPQTVNYYGKFEASLKTIESIGAYSKQTSQSHNLLNNGWI